jgi:hypothetical protein
MYALFNRDGDKPFMLLFGGSQLAEREESPAKLQRRREMI